MTSANVKIIFPTSLLLWGKKLKKVIALGKAPVYRVIAEAKTGFPLLSSLILILIFFFFILLFQIFFLIFSFRRCILQDTLLAKTHSIICIK